MVDESDNPVMKWLSSSVPDKLWHYTSIQGFCGIVSSKKIFATDIRYLNDSEEFIHTRKLVEQVINEAPEKDESGWPLRESLRLIILRIFEKGSLSPDNLQIYTASFSASEDQLSQWRGYSHGSSGMSLGFDLRQLRPPSEIGTLVTFAPCVYREDDKRELITYAIYSFARDLSSLWQQAGDATAVKKLLQEMREAYPEWDEEKAKNELKQTMSEWHDSEIRRAGAVITIELLRLAAILKHPSFEEEHEWRLILPVSTSTTPQHNPRCFRPSDKTIIPYIEFPLNTNSDATVPLTDLILGPGTEPVLGKDAARCFLASKNINIIPRESNVPFRLW
jgi:hypothetical protein